MHVSFARDARPTYEYGCDLRRLYPWDGVSNPLWGSAIATVRPGESTTPHSHDEEETFVVISGTGMMQIADEQAEVGPGDVIYLPRNTHHTIVNRSDSEVLQFITIFWGSPEANERMIALSRQFAAA
jgi:mannose-6-phosphate isomerase-like protein (cupin superfamily)